MNYDFQEEISSLEQDKKVLLTSLSSVDNLLESFEKINSLEKDKNILLTSLSSVERLLNSIKKVEEESKSLIKAKEDWNSASKEWDRISQVKEDLKEKVKITEKSLEGDTSKKDLIEKANLHLKEARDAWGVAQENYDDCAKIWDDVKKSNAFAKDEFKITEKDWEDKLDKWIKLCGRTSKIKLRARKIYED